MSRDEVQDDLLEHHHAVEDCPLAVRFDGLLEGTIRDQQRFELAVVGLGHCGPPSFDVSHEGNLCTLLVNDERHPGQRFTAAHWQRLIDQLSEVVASFHPDQDIGSTLRCTEYLPNHLRETLVLCDHDQLRVATRLRPRPSDQAAEDPDEAPRPHRRWQVLLLVVLAGALLLWQNGTWSRLISTTGAPLQVDRTATANLLTAVVSESWGTYDVVLRRGPGYPATPQELTKRLAATATLQDRAMLNLVANGAELCLVLEDGDHRPLSTTIISLRPLLVGSDGQAVAHIPGDMAARHLRLALAAPAGGP